MELDEALTQISEIRRQMSRTETFRGYRAAPVAFSGGLAILAAVVQAVWLPSPQTQLGSYLLLWIGVAVLSAGTTWADVWLRSRHTADSCRQQLTWLAVEQFAPCVVAGAVVTAVIATRSADSAWMLPGLWAILVSLGMFSSYRLLPRPIFWIAVYYLITGGLALALCRDGRAFSPWAMAIPFGGGQFAAAVVLHETLERSDA